MLDKKEKSVIRVLYMCDDFYLSIARHDYIDECGHPIKQNDIYIFIKDNRMKISLSNRILDYSKHLTDKVTILIKDANIQINERFKELLLTRNPPKYCECVKKAIYAKGLKPTITINDDLMDKLSQLKGDKMSTQINNNDYTDILESLNQFDIDFEENFKEKIIKVPLKNKKLVISRSDSEYYKVKNGNDNIFINFTTKLINYVRVQYYISKAQKIHSDKGRDYYIHNEYIMCINKTNKPISEIGFEDFKMVHFNNL